MKNLLSIVMATLPVVALACSETVVKKATAPADATGADSGDQADAGNTAPEADPCACPNTCASTTESDGRLVCKPAAPPETLPEGQQIGKYQITGYEYWQWKKKDPYAGGDEVAWGYNGDGEPQANPPVLPTDASRACMAESRKVLEDILTNDVPPELDELRVKHKLVAFWQWNNDMTDTKAGVEASDDYQSLWLFDSRLIKWMSHTERDGTCRLPTRADLVKFAKGCSTAFPTCYNARF